VGRIPQHFIDELIARADIVEVIGSRVQLKKAGREWKACCPFHNEKTPSFWVSPDKQFYHCFGCGKHGTVLGFLMDHDHLAFPEAVEDLAARLGLEVPREGGGDAAAPRAEEPLYELMGRVARYYVECLGREPRAREYLAKRGLSAETLERFQIGYAVNSWNDLLKRFGDDDLQRRRLADTGLIIERERSQTQFSERHYDRFRDRIMFPIRDTRGRVIAFGGRVIDAGEPKYLNSPETVLKLLQECDALRRPERFGELLEACEADARGRTGFETHPYPQAAYLRAALAAAAAVTLPEEERRNLSGPAIGAEIKRRRVVAVTAVKSAAAPQ
jgi:DNA primase